MAVVAHFQCSKWLNLKSFRILYFPTLFNKSICDSCKRNGKADERERKKSIQHPKRIYHRAHILHFSWEWNIRISLSVSITFDFTATKIPNLFVCVCATEENWRSQLRKVLNTRMHMRTKKAKKRKQNENLNAKCEKKMGVSKRVREKKNIGGMKSDSFFSEMKKKTSLMVTSTVRETRK